jgi:hypothetical protein
MKLIIAGGRDFKNFSKLIEQVDAFRIGSPTLPEVISGGARGADKLGEKYAKERGFPIKEFIPDWETFGKSAGIRRNVEMANYATHLIAFWDGKSKGTEHMIRTAQRKGLQIKIVKY